MQTPLHTPQSLISNMRQLHWSQLGAMVREIDQMLEAISYNRGNWIGKHLVTRSWANHYPTLALLGVIAYREWMRRYQDGERGGKLLHLSGERILNRWAEIGCPVAVAWPAWYGDPRMTANHRGRLLEKKPDWYKQFGWDVAPVKENWYPLREGGYQE